MGALPSRESNEGPNTVYFSNNTGVVTFHLPLTPHYFPSPDCLAFKEVHRVRDSQSCKYSFNIREASAVLPDALARDFAAAQDEDWGPEAEAADPSLHYRDAEIQTQPAENSFGAGEAKHHGGAAAASSRHVRRSLERRHELYEALVVDPTTNALVDTDAEMREIFLQEQRWRAARETVRRHRAFLRQQNMTELQRAELDDEEVVAADVNAAELEAAEAVPPPRMWLRPIPEVVVERMTMEDTCAAHRAYREHHGASTAAAAAATEEKLQRPHGGSPLERHETRCNRGRGLAESKDSNNKNDEVALSVLDVQGRQPLVENETLNEEMLKSYPCFQENQLPFEMDEQYMDGRVHMVAYEGVNYLFAYNPDYVRAMGKTVVVDGSVVEERRRESGAAQHARGRGPFTTTFTVATRQADDFEDPNQRRAYEIFQPIYARYYLPVIPVRVLGVDGFIPCRGPTNDGGHNDNSGGTNSHNSTHTAAAEVRGAPWMRGVAGDESEEEYEERQLLQRYGVSPPPVLRSCRFIHAVIGDKILNRMSILGCMTFRERCLNAGLPDAIACPLWGVMEVSDIPQLQFQREVELRLLAAIHEIDDGDMRIRDALARRHQWNDYISFTNSPMYGYMVSAPPERRFRPDADGKLVAINTTAAAEEDTESRSSSSGNDREKNEEEQQQQQRKRTNANNNNSNKASTAPSTEKPQPSSSSTTSSTVLTTKATTAPAQAALALSLGGATNSSGSSDTESRDDHSGNTSARSAAHSSSTSITIVDHVNGESTKDVLGTRTGDGGTARVKRTRDGHTCIGGRAPPETAEQNAALATAMAKAGCLKACVVAATAEPVNSDAAAVQRDDDLGIFPAPPENLMCTWSFKRRRLGITEEVVVNPNYSAEEWMPMVNPVTKDAALARIGVRVSLRGRVVLVRYSAAAMQKVVYYLSQASAPIFCLPYVGPPQQCPNVYLANVLRAPPAASAAPQNGLLPPTASQIAKAVAGYAQGRVSCYVFVNLNDRAANPPTSCRRNHRRDDELMAEPTEAGVTSKLILSQVPIKADGRCALDWYRKTLQYPPLPAPNDAEGAVTMTAESPYATWPTLLDAPAPCDGDVLVVCPRTHRWIRVTTLIVLVSLFLEHKKSRDKAPELEDPAPVLDLFNDEHFAEEVCKCFRYLTHKNMDSEGMQCSMLHMRSFISYNGIVELVLDRLRTIVDLEKYEDKDDEGWLVLHDTPTTASSSLASFPTVTTTATTSSTTSRTTFGPPNSGAAAFTSQKYVESGSYFIWSFPLLGQRFFFGTKPRFIRLALQRQKQNQRRRQKRKERDTVAEASASAAPTSAKHNGATPPRSSSDATVTAVAKGRSSTVHSEGSLHGSLDGSSHSSSSSTVRLQSHSHSNDGEPFAPQTTFTAVPVPAALASHDGSRIPITAADRSQLVYDGVHLSSYDATHRHHNGNSSGAHLPYAPLHLTSKECLRNDECNEMRECRQLHRQWMESRGVVVASPASSSGVAAAVLSQLPLGSARDTSRWELPQLTGQTSCRRRLVVPIAPHGIGRPQLVDLGDVQGGVSGFTDAFRDTTAAKTVNEEDGTVPVQKSGSPVVMDAQRTSYRWNPYKVGE